ncbi:hypothetical protein [Methanothrix sp.]|uniref:hypothetical protein n=1 Tax=Methanothrix sp. TaxID=90426 RepID=UPI00329A5370
MSCILRKHLPTLAISIDPQYADAWYNKDVALKALGRTSEADAAFAKAEELENKA